MILTAEKSASPSGRACIPASAPGPGSPRTPAIGPLVDAFVSHCRIDAVPAQGRGPTVSPDMTRTIMKRQLLEWNQNPQFRHIVEGLLVAAHQKRISVNIYAGEILQDGRSAGLYSGPQRAWPYGAICCTQLVDNSGPIPQPHVLGFSYLVHESLHCLFDTDGRPEKSPAYTPDTQHSLSRACLADAAMRKTADRRLSGTRMHGLTDAARRARWQQQELLEHTTSVFDLAPYFPQGFDPASPDDHATLRTEAIVRPMQAMALGIPEHEVTRLSPRVSHFYRAYGKPHIEAYVAQHLGAMQNAHAAGACLFANTETGLTQWHTRNAAALGGLAGVSATLIGGCGKRTWLAAALAGFLGGAVEARTLHGYDAGQAGWSFALQNHLSDSARTLTRMPAAYLGTVLAGGALGSVTYGLKCGAGFAAGFRRARLPAAAMMAVTFVGDKTAAWQRVTRT